MTPVLVIPHLPTTNQSCYLVVDSCHLARCIDLSWLYPFRRAPVRGHVGACFCTRLVECEQNISLVKAKLPAEVHFVQPDTTACSLGRAAQPLSSPDGSQEAIQPCWPRGPRGCILCAYHRSKLMPCCSLHWMPGATTQFARWKQSRDTTMLAFSWLYAVCFATIKVNAFLLAPDM